MSRGTVVFDLDGVVYLDREGIPGAADALRTISDAGFNLRYATNNSSKTADDVAAHIAQRTGFDAASADAVTSSQATATYVARHHRSAFVVGPPALTHELVERDVAIVPAPEADAVVVGLDRSLTFDAIDLAARAIRNGAAFVASNIDPTYPTPTGFSPGAGAIVAAVATAAGATPIVCGKPTPIFASILAETIPTGPVWMVGDRLDSDVALGRSNGWTTILVLTGATSESDAVDAEPRPDHIVASIADVPSLLDESADAAPSGG